MADEKVVHVQIDDLLVAGNQGKRCLTLQTNRVLFRVIRRDRLLIFVSKVA